MVYLRRFSLPSESAETRVIMGEGRTCFSTFYPFGIFPDKGLRELRFDAVTMLYGTNGSGKSTLLNAIAETTGAVRYAEFNDAPFFRAYTDLCYAEYARRPKEICVLTSDDVFDYVLRARVVNGRIDNERDALFEKYVQVHAEAINDPSIGRLKGLDDYERWSEVREILSPRRTQSAYVKKRVARDVDLYSNGETAMRYFLDRIDGEGVYLLDEPENSLSIALQIELASYIEATARTTGAQFIIATHSPVLLSMRGARIYDLDTRGVPVSDWTELANVRRYFDFFMERKAEFCKE